MLTAQRSGSVASAGGCGATQRQQACRPGVPACVAELCSSVGAGQLLEGRCGAGDGRRGKGHGPPGASEPTRARPRHPESRQLLPCAPRAAEVTEAQGLPVPV